MFYYYIDYLYLFIENLPVIMDQLTENIMGMGINNTTPSVESGTSPTDYVQV